MKLIQDIVDNSRLSRLIAVCAMTFVANTFPMMQSKSQRQIAAGSQIIRMKKMQEQKKEGLRAELMAANWLQEKIKEIRQRRDLKGKSLYGGRRSSAQQEGPAEKVLNDLLIDHYAEKIRQALQAIPLDARAQWASDFRLILSIGLDNFLKEGGIKRYYAGLLPTIGGVDDGSEIGIAGTKFRAMKKVKDETNDFITIPFDGSLPKITPAEFFKSLAYDVSAQTGAGMGQQKESGLTLQQQKVLAQEWEGVDIDALAKSKAPVKIEKPRVETAGISVPQNKYLIYGKEGIHNGIFVDKVVAENNSEMIRGMVAGTGGTENKIELPFSIDAIRLVFGTGDIKKVSLDLLGQAIQCADYLLWLDNYSQVFIDTIADKVVEVADKLMQISDKIYSDRRSLAEIKKDIHYSEFEKLNEVLGQAVVQVILLNKNNVLQRYVSRFNSEHGLSSGRRQEKKRSREMPYFFNDKQSVSEILNIFLDYVQAAQHRRQQSEESAELFTRQRQEQEEANKWFWQRKS